MVTNSMGMDLKDYFSPVDLNLDQLHHPMQFGFSIEKFSKDRPIPLTLEGYDLVILGVPEDRNSSNKGCAHGADEIRHCFYQLYRADKRLRIFDLGNLKKGKRINDTYFGLRDVIVYLRQCKTLPIVIGGSNDLLYSAFLAYEKREEPYNIVNVDSRLDIGNAEVELNSFSYASQIFMQRSLRLYNYTNLGYQTYLVPTDEIDLMNNLFFDAVRLGLIRGHVSHKEPILRDADIVSIDISSVKQSDAPGTKFSSPNGLSSDEICQIALYAGLSDKVSFFGIFETNPDFDRNGQTASLGAQIVWSFIEGYLSRKNDYPVECIENYAKFIVQLAQSEHEIVFYKSQGTERWWMEIPYGQNKEQKKIVACDYEDYQKASHDGIPDIWWKNLQKLE
jgi:formiminoglutamase